MQEIKQYKNAEDVYVADVNIDVEEWKSILRKDFISAKCRDTLIKFYEEPDHKSTCRFLAEKHNESPNYFNASITNFGKQIQNELNRFKVVRENGEACYWNIPMIGKRLEDNSFEWQLREELVQAMKELKYADEKEWDYRRFKKLLEYFVTHLEYMHTDNKHNRGYEAYIKPIKNFKKTGKGNAGDKIQNQIANWDVYNDHKLCITIIASFGDYTSRACYLHWRNTPLNIIAEWNKEMEKITSLYQAKFQNVEGNQDWETLVEPVSLEDLGLFENAVSEELKRFKDNYLALINQLKQKEKQSGNMEKLNDYINLLKFNKNLILTGAPGTGKTYLAKQMAKQIIFGEVIEELSAEEEEIWQHQFGFVQFHPSYDYTDFVEGLRPTPPDESGNIGFELRNGVFKEFCKRAKTNNEPEAIDSFDEAWEQLLHEVRKNESEEKLTEIGNWKYGLSLRNSLKYSSKNTPSKYSFTITKNNVYAAYQGRIARPSGAFQKDMEDVVRYMGERFNLKPYDMVNKSYTNSDTPFVFVIDEINRGELSKIFGELFFSIDPGYRGKEGKVKTQYTNLQEDETIFDMELGEGWFYVPENVYIIGTMNDIDRSVESMDFAIRRRFAWKEIKTTERIEMLEESIPEFAEEAKKRLGNLNEAIDKIQGLNSAYHIGPSYFLKIKVYEGNFNKLWDFHIEGILMEYLRGYPDAENKLKELKVAYDNQLASIDEMF